MTRERANKFIGKLVKVTFKEDWFNDAIGEFVLEDGGNIGVLKHCECEGQEHLYILETDNWWLPTNCACWSANRMKKIEEVL